MGVIHYGLLSFAMWASYLHWYALVRHDGQPKLESAFIAGCVDLSVYLATLYRQRDHRIGRKASFGFCTFPNFALVAMIGVSAAGNVAEAKPTFGGVAVALIPTITFLLALTLGERDLAETDRRRSRQRLEAQRPRRGTGGGHPPPRRGRAAPSGGPRRGGASRRRARAQASRCENAGAAEPRLSVSPGSSVSAGQCLAERLGRLGRAPCRPAARGRANTPDRRAMWAAGSTPSGSSAASVRCRAADRAAGCTRSSIGRRMAPTGARSSLPSPSWRGRRPGHERPAQHPCWHDGSTPIKVRVTSGGAGYVGFELPGDDRRAPEAARSLLRRALRGQDADDLVLCADELVCNAITAHPQLASWGPLPGDLSRLKAVASSWSASWTRGPGQTRTPPPARLPGRARTGPGDRPRTLDRVRIDPAFRGRLAWFRIKVCDAAAGRDVLPVSRDAQRDAAETLLRDVAETLARDAGGLRDLALAGRRS